MRPVLRTHEFVKAGSYESKEVADRFRGAAGEEGIS